MHAGLRDNQMLSRRQLPKLPSSMRLLFVQFSIQSGYNAIDAWAEAISMLKSIAWSTSQSGSESVDNVLCA